jgi:ATP phosphoribosyltransferase
MSDLILAIPSKGRLQEQTLTFLQDCGLPAHQSGGARGYVAQIAALPGVEVRLLSAGDIASELRDGGVHFGVTGEDLLRELGAGFQKIALVKALGFGRADLVVAAPAGWLDVTCMADLDAVCALQRQRTGARLRIATKYVRLTQEFFTAHGMIDYRLVESAGATEGAPAAGAAEAIVDITTSGATLAANQLRPLVDGVILRSQAQLAAALSAPWPEATRKMARRFLDVIEARARGKATRLVRINAGQADHEELTARMLALGARPAAGDGAMEAAFYCPEEQCFTACAVAAALGAGPIGVFQPDFVFEPNNLVFDQLAARL